MGLGHKMGHPVGPPIEMNGPSYDQALSMLCEQAKMGEDGVLAEYLPKASMTQVRPRPKVADAVTKPLITNILKKEPYIALVFC